MANTKCPALMSSQSSATQLRDSELCCTITGVPVVNFKVASNKKYGDNLAVQREEVCHKGVVAGQELAANCSWFFKKDSAVLVEGKLRSRRKEYQDSMKLSSFEIRAWQVQLM